MILSTIAHIFSALLELTRISRMSGHDKDLEILFLRYQLGFAFRRLNRALKPHKSEKLSLTQKVLILLPACCSLPFTNRAQSILSAKPRASDGR